METVCLKLIQAESSWKLSPSEGARWQTPTNFFVLAQAAARDHSHHKTQHLQYWQFHVLAGNDSENPESWKEEYVDCLVPAVCHP